MKALFFLMIFSSGAQAAVLCQDGKDRIEFSLENREAKINGGATIRCRESQATSAFYCVLPHAELDETFEAVVNLDRDRNPVSGRILSGEKAQAKAMACKSI